MLANFGEHTRTLRLYPRPIVAFQSASFLRSRSANCKQTEFLAAFAASQSVECFAEWALMPSNLAFQRVQTSVYDPRAIGDKPKW